MASARNDEQGSIQAALREMKGRKFSSYRHAGVELAFVAGQDKLRVRITKDATDAAAGVSDEVLDEVAGAIDLNDDPLIGGEDAGEGDEAPV